MPLFSRSDGDLITTEPPVRRIMPYLMRGRNESIVLHRTHYDLSETLPWLDEFNSGRQRKATLFHLFLYAFARALHERPGLNRFVSGGRVYQRRGVHLAFAAKKAFSDDAPFVTLKLEFPANESFAACVDRVTERIDAARRGNASAVDSELALAMALPGWLLRVGVAALRWLDRINLMPARMIRPDPMYSSVFVANLGSVGLDDTFHHLYEYGTTSLFGAIGQVHEAAFVDDGGQLGVRREVLVCWSFDERINDGFYCATALEVAKRIVEHPGAYIEAVSTPPSSSRLNGSRAPANVGA